MSMIYFFIMPRNHLEHRLYKEKKERMFVAISLKQDT
jgi:hypothetical protein